MNTATLEKASKQVARELATLLADSYLLFVKTQNFHWNVEDPRFHSLHEFFEEQYKELFEAIDVIAERIRALGEKSPGSLKEFLELSRLEESPTNLSANEMIKTLLRDHESIIQWLKKEIDETAQLGDAGSSDLCINRIRAHEKTAWMLRSHLTR